MARPKIEILEPEFLSEQEAQMLLQELIGGQSLLLLAADLGLEKRTLLNWLDGKVPTHVATLLRFTKLVPPHLWPEGLMPNTQKYLLGQLQAAFAEMRGETEDASEDA